MACHPPFSISMEFFSLSASKVTVTWVEHVLLFKVDIDLSAVRHDIGEFISNHQSQCIASKSNPETSVFSFIARDIFPTLMCRFLLQDIAN